MTSTMNRRKALTVVAAAPVAVALGGSAVGDDGAGGKLAALVKRYFEEVDAFNANPPEGDGPFFEEQPYDLTLSQMLHTPVRTRQDALAVIDFMEREDLLTGRWDVAGEDVLESLVSAIRGYIEGRAP